MEFYDIGKQCKLCAQHDYLPFLCDCCGEYYCLAHRDYVSHSCSKAGNKRITSETCPSCNREIKIDCSKDLEAQLRNHFVNECTHVKKAKTPKCPVKGCGKKLYASSSTMCSKCHTKFCLAHRFPDTHDCKCQAGKLESPSLFAQLIKRVSLSKARDQAQEESLPEGICVK